MFLEYTLQGNPSRGGLSDNNGFRRIVRGGVTFKDFAVLAKRRGWTPEFLAEEFRGKIEEPSEFFHRVLSCKYKGEDRSWVVIPYLSVLEFYNRELSPLIVEGEVRLCECKCGRRVHGKKRYASAACRKKDSAVLQARDHRDGRV